MYECDDCHKSSDNSRYHIPVIAEQDEKKIIVHIECCSEENLIKLLREKVNSEKFFYDDVQKLLHNLSIDNINEFERKYGNYEEFSKGLKIDMFIEVLALIDQLKKKKHSDSRC